jgi:hypothetical protein
MVALLRAFISLASLSLGALVLYAGQFVETNAYIGIGELPFERFEYWWLMAIWLLALALLMPTRVNRPSDVYFVLYVVGCGLWSATYWPAAELLDAAGAASLFALLILPAVAVKALLLVGRWPKGDSSLIGMLGRAQLVPLLIGLLAFSALLGYRVAGSDAGFDVEEAYVRRIQGRESFSGNSLAAYMLQMGANGFAPFAAFIGTLRRSRILVLAAIGFGVLCFWLLGLKSPLLNVILLAGLAWMFRSGQISRFGTWLMGAVGLVLLLSVVELAVFDYSLLAEFGMRRVILVSSTIQTYFMDAMIHNPAAWLSGLGLAGHATPEFYIGAKYLGSDLANANTNAFLHELAQNGVFGYLYVVVGVAVLLAWCDHAWRDQGRADGFAFATILGVLTLEQALTIVLVSSGLLVCVGLSALCSRMELPHAMRRMKSTYP